MLKLAAAIFAIFATAALLAFWPRAVDLLLPAAVAFAFLLALLCGWGVHQFKERLDFIALCLMRAERTMNNLLFLGLDQSGAKGRIPIRMDWAKLVPPTPQIIAGFKQSEVTGFRSPVYDIWQMYEKELAGGKGDKRLIGQTANLVRELADGSVRGAQLYVAAEWRENGKLPYVAPGIDELIGIKHFDTVTGNFPRGSGERGWIVRYVARARGFPQGLIMVPPGTQTVYRGRDVLERATRLYE